MRADGRLLPHLFAARAAANPDAVAVRHGDDELTYRELDARANRLAHHLIRRGAGPGRLVAVVLDRSADLVVALLAVAKSGAGYVPVAADDPPARVRHILADSAPVLVISDVLPEVAEDCPDTAPAGPSGADVAYVIYTSGSTGRPKGVAVGHDALACYLDHAVTHYPSVAGRTLLHSSVSFDMTVTSLYAPLLAGGTVVVADLTAALSGDESLRPELRPTFLKVTPSHLAVLTELPAVYSPTEQLVVGGEALTGAVLDRWRRDHPDVTVINEYGPTEATVGCCVHSVLPGAAVPAAVPIGVPTAGTRLYVLDEHLRPAPDSGELFIGGGQVARGYLNRPELTRDRFLPDPAGGLMYRTGDLVRRLPDGDLVYLGRLDDQVKVNGYRIEPGEIEAALLDSGLVTQARVTTREARGVRSLVAYVVGDAGADALREHVAARLPAYMIPADFVVLDTLPLTPNGKLDLDALAAPARADAGVRDRWEEMLCGIAGTVLGVSDVDVDADFISLGGTSISAARLVTRARRAGLDITLMDVLRKRTVRAILAGGTRG